MAQTCEVVSSFGPVPGGVNPLASLVQATDGNLYGTTSLGGGVNEGTLFRIVPGGSISVFYSFSWSGPDGGQPDAELMQASNGNLYGTTSTGTTNNAGTVFCVSTNGTVTTLHAFSRSGGDGYYPAGCPIQAKDGNLYGMTPNGGAYGSSYGTVFRLSTNGAYAIIHSFNGYDGAGPQSRLIQARDNNLYGTTMSGGNYGNAFRITTNGDVTSLHSFQGSDGMSPVSALIEAADGFLYGTTTWGGVSNKGVVFRLSTNGAFNILYSFKGPEGAGPLAGLLQTSDGSLYGTTCYGGSNGVGTVFALTTNGNYSLIHSFSGNDLSSTDGGNPSAGLIQANDGDIYGTAKIGGTYGDGVVFRLRMPPRIHLGINSSIPGICSVTAGGLTGHGQVVLFSCVDLANWQPIATNAATVGSTTFSGLSTTNRANLFFRVQEE